MRHISHLHSSTATQLIAAIEEFSGACDPDFDSGFDELEHQFAEIPLTFDHN